MKKRLAIILLMAIVVCAVAFAACDIPAPHEHNLEHVDAKAPTCDELGTEEYWRCTGCEKLFADEKGETEITAAETVAALGHEWGEWSVTTPATCTAKGVETRVCSHDSTHTETRDIAATGHVNTTHVDGTAATCTVAGKKAHDVCGCGALLIDGVVVSESDLVIAIDQNAHAWGEVTYTWAENNSTCTATRTCANDDSHVEKETVNAVAKVTQEATCTLVELKTYTATFENSAFAQQVKENVQTADALGHTLTHHDEVAATCTENGTVEYWSCSVCEKNFADSQGETELTELVIAALGHSFDEGSNFTPTHGTWTCTVCDHTEQRVVWGQPITVNGKSANNDGGNLLFDEDNGIFYLYDVSTGTTRQFYANTKNTTGYYTYTAVLNTVRLSGDDNIGAVVGFAVTSGSVTIDFKSAWWEGNKLCINVNGKEISISNFSHSLQASNSDITTSKFAVTVKRIGNALYIYDVNGNLAVILDSDGVHAQGGRTINNNTTDALTGINSLLPQFFADGIENVCGTYATEAGRTQVNYNISYSELVNATGKVTLPDDVTADLSQTRIVVERNGVYETYSDVVNANGEYSLLLPTGSAFNLTFTNPAILGGSLQNVVLSVTNSTIDDVELVYSNASSSSVIINNMEIKLGADEDDSSNVAVTKATTKEVVIANSVYGGEAKYTVSMAGSGYQGLLTAGITDGNSIMRISMRNGYVNKFEFEYCLLYASKDGSHVSNYRTYMITASFLPSYNYGRTFTNSGNGPQLGDPEWLTFTFLKKADGSLELYYGEYLLITINADGFYLSANVTCTNCTNTEGRLDDKPQDGWIAYAKPESDFVAVDREYAVWGHVDGMTADVTYGIKATIEPIVATSDEE